MTRSHRHSELIRVRGEDEPEWKRIERRRLRHLNKQRVNKDEDPLIENEVIDEWGWPSDGMRRMAYRPNGEEDYKKIARK